MHRVPVFLASAGLLLLTALPSAAAEDATAVDLLGSGLDAVTDSLALPKAMILVGVEDSAGDVATSDASTYAAVVLAVDPKTGAELWRDTLDRPGLPDVITSVDGDTKSVCVAGARGDDDGDGEDNVFVRCYDAKKGTVLWTHEYEAPTGPGEVLFWAFGNGFADDDLIPNVRVGKKSVLLNFHVTVPSTTSETTSILFDKKTGAPL